MECGSPFGGGRSERGPVPEGRAFTLIELLVVISILVLLMALLFPALTGARRQSQAIGCQARLRQLGQLAAIYVQDNAGQPRKKLWYGTYADVDPVGIWRLFSRAHALENRKLLLCPSATRPSALEPIGCGDTFRAYAIGLGFNPPPHRRDILGYASFGINRWIDQRAPQNPWIWKGAGWQTTEVKGASAIPVFFDCAVQGAGPYHLDAPREHEHLHEHYDYHGNWIAPSFFETSMSPVCLNRHQSGVNVTFMDWSVRRVGLKELWTLKWHPEYETTGPWTKAGGALPEDWPPWMRQFRDY